MGMVVFSFLCFQTSYANNFSSTIYRIDTHVNLEISASEIFKPQEISPLNNYRLNEDRWFFYFRPYIFFKYVRKFIHPVVSFFQLFFREFFQLSISNSLESEVRTGISPAVGVGSNHIGQWVGRTTWFWSDRYGFEFQHLPIVSKYYRHNFENFFFCSHQIYNFQSTFHIFNQSSFFDRI